MKGGKKEMFKIFKEDLRIDAKIMRGDVKAHEIKYGKWKDTNSPDLIWLSKHPGSHWFAHHQ